MSIATISPSEFFEKSKGKSIDLIDVRTPLEFSEVHVANARNFPLDRLDPKSIARERVGSTGDPIYIICRSGSRGQKACVLFHEAGITEVVNIEGGTLACAAAGLPVIRGGKTVSLERQVRIAAGFLVLTGVVLGWVVHPGFWALSGMVGAGLMFAGITNTCAMGLLLAKMPWNQTKPSTC